ncbi:uncharacterized protein SCHCODRAFT_02688881 [Schizophyllum commune H4-8]|nr:uncharacterized protein SCHCODRAFT_02688881 [Schizophyllum commune H4-8]KAI5892565.1 hypothetical protein SCHCODRAFT_02688881 [Schizophyllum commune H4-8]
MTVTAVVMGVTRRETEPPITIATFRAPSGLSDSTSGSAPASPTPGSPGSQQIAPPSLCERLPHGFDLSDRKFVHFTNEDDYENCDEQPCPHFRSSSIPCPRITEEEDNETPTLIIPTVTRYFPILVPSHVSTPRSFARTQSPLDMSHHDMETNIEDGFADQPEEQPTMQQRLALMEQSIQQQQTLTYQMTQLLLAMANRSSSGHKPLAKVNPPPTFDGNRANGRAFLDAAEVYVGSMELYWQLML